MLSSIGGYFCSFMCQLHYNKSLSNPSFVIPQVMVLIIGETNVNIQFTFSQLCMFLLQTSSKIKWAKMVQMENKFAPISFVCF